VPSIYEAFETNSVKEKAGITLDYGIYGKFRVARAGGTNKRFAVYYNERLKPVRRLADAGKLPEEQAQRILAEVWAETIVLGWEDVKDRDESQIPYSKEKCVELLIKLPDLFADLREQSSLMVNFQGEPDADVKNL
jgi:hypothetical protein